MSYPFKRISSIIKMSILTAAIGQFAPVFLLVPFITTNLHLQFLLVLITFLNI